MGICWTRCCGIFRRETSRLQRAGGGSKYFKTTTRGEHFTIEFENLVESDEGESPGSSIRPLSEEEVFDLKEKHYDSITERQRTDDIRLQNELALQEEKLKLEEEALYAAQREAARAAKQRKILEQHRLQWIKQRALAAKNGEDASSVSEDFETYLQNLKSQYGAFRSSRMNRMIPMKERSKTEEDILRAALKHSGKKPGSHGASASDDSNGLEWENDFVSAEMDDNGNSEYAGFVNPVTELSAQHQNR
ncbi:hypothetical protein XENTR_v10000870 [Xenopus tropicalis]|nr:hypothetical protein XENTR_v10000870 [Xenopus tropicalis]